MKYSKATNYALHTIMYLTSVASEKRIGVQQLAEVQGVSPTYLSKILTKLVKAGMIDSVSGANGGYKLKPNWEAISFLEIIHAIEGSTSLFDCCLNHNPECLIQKVMVSAEEKMEQELLNQTIGDLSKKMTVTL